MSRGDIVLDVLVACAFNCDAHSSDFDSLGRIPVLKARMNAYLHMAADMKNTGKSNLFVIFGEPDIDILPAENDQVKVKINGVDYRRGAQRRPRWQRLLVHRHRLQRGKLLRPPRLLPRR